MNSSLTDSERAGWSVPAWTRAVGIGRSTTFNLLKHGTITSVRIGKRRIIMTPPREFLDRLAREQRATSATK